MKSQPIYSFDDRRFVALPGNKEESVQFAAKHLVDTAKEAIEKRGECYLALSGGSTPKAIYQVLARDFANQLDWSKVWIFWSDERSVPATHPDSNYKMAMENGIGDLPIPGKQILRMVAEENIEANAAAYEQLIREVVDDLEFDLIMLGMGDDGHTASLFPNSPALAVEDRLVTPNFVEKKDTYRMTFTFSLINRARHKVLYVIGDNKKDMVPLVLFDKNHTYPSGNIGTKEKKALWVLDQGASSLLLKNWRPKRNAA